MTPYWFGGIIIAFIAYSGACVYSGYKYEYYKLSDAQAAADLTASQHVNTVIQQQSSITQGATYGYSQSIAAIADLYKPIGVPTPDVNHLPIVSHTTSRTKPASCVSKKYKLTLEKCDDAKANAIALWDAWVAQAAVK